jgi:hypothetical protein
MSEQDSTGGTGNSNPEMAGAGERAQMGLFFGQKRGSIDAANEIGLDHR